MPTRICPHVQTPPPRHSLISRQNAMTIQICRNILRLTTDISNKDLIFKLDTCTKIGYFLHFVSIYIISFFLSFFISLYKHGPKRIVATNFILRLISYLDFAVLTVFTSPFEVQVEWRTPSRSK